MRPNIKLLRSWSTSWPARSQLMCTAPDGTYVEVKYCVRGRSGINEVRVGLEKVTEICGTKESSAQKRIDGIPGSRASAMEGTRYLSGGS